jgi:type IV fimbrial biogenesis protein FimT
MRASSSQSRSRLAGYTLVELMIIVTVLGILLSVATPSFIGVMANTRMKGAASDLHMALLKARSEAVKRNASVSVTQKTGGWTNGWQVAVGATVLGDQGPMRNVTITEAASATSVTYLRSGRIQGAAPFFSVETDGANIARCVTVEVSGMPTVRKNACP